jgi:hypothetical protein
MLEDDRAIFRGYNGGRCGKILHSSDEEELADNPVGYLQRGQISPSAMPEEFRREAGIRARPFHPPPDPVAVGEEAEGAGRDEPAPLPGCEEEDGKDRCMDKGIEGISRNLRVLPDDPAGDVVPCGRDD